MKTVHKSVLLWYSPAQMYALVTDVASYPQFLPWCDKAQVLQQGELGGARGDGWLQLGEGAAAIPQASQQGANPVAVAVELAPGEGKAEAAFVDWSGWIQQAAQSHLLKGG